MGARSAKNPDQIVAIHQPNYLPWLGYFKKIREADVFVFLDDVPFSKGSYTNRVRIEINEAPAWLTVPVRTHLGQAIVDVEVSNAQWPNSHRDRLFNAYRGSAHFRDVWLWFEPLLLKASGTLAQINCALIEAISMKLDLGAEFRWSSAIPVGDHTADERLVRIVAAIAPGGVYVSGAGGANYQSEETFVQHGVELRYLDYAPAPYQRSGKPFCAGLSIIDALFHLGVERTRQLLANG